MAMIAVPLSQVLHGDRTLLTAAVVGVAQALFALGELVQDPRVAVRLSGQSGGGPIALVITQPSAVLSETALARFFEAGWAERPGDLQQSSPSCWPVRLPASIAHDWKCRRSPRRERRLR